MTLGTSHSAGGRMDLNFNFELTKFRWQRQERERERGDRHIEVCYASCIVVYKSSTLCSLVQHVISLRFVAEEEKR